MKTTDTTIALSARLTTDEIALEWIRCWAPEFLPSYNEERGAFRRSLACKRCGGRGHLNCYSHIDGGVCFECGGAPSADAVAWDSPRTVARRERPKVRRARRKAEEAEARRQARIRDWEIALQEHPWLPQVLEADHYLARKARAVLEQREGLSLEWIEDLERLRDQLATAVPVAQGRYEITGRVLGWKSVPGFARGSVDMKMLLDVEVENGSFRLWGSVPAALLEECLNRGAFHDWLKGARVKMKATVRRGDRDESFGFYARPACVSVLEPGVPS